MSKKELKGYSKEIEEIESNGLKFVYKEDNADVVERDLTFVRGQYDNTNYFSMLYIALHDHSYPNKIDKSIKSIATLK